jgi:hypothetical protein
MRDWSQLGDLFDMITITPDGFVYYMHFLMGKISYDHYTFILFRHAYQRVLKHDAYGCSELFLKELIELGCKLVLIKVDNRTVYKIRAEEMMQRGIHDRLEPTQSMHVFVPIDELEMVQC